MRAMDAPTALGMVGLGVMGRNLAHNAADREYRVAAFDPWPEARRRFAEAPDDPSARRIALCDDYPGLTAALPTPRVVMIMVKAGAPVDAAIGALSPLLEPGDTLIDGGNSHFRDTMRRERALADLGLSFIGLGVSGGAFGARFGPSLMAGGTARAYVKAGPILEAIAAEHGGAPCCALLGRDGAGHFVKTVHNGIEYGIMQMLAEAYVLLRDLGGLDHAALAATFRDWNRGPLASFLVEAAADVLETPDDLAEGPLVEAIRDTAGHKGTGQWSSEAALDLGVAAPTLTGAVFARYLAALRDERLAAAPLLTGPPIAPVAEPAALAADLQAALAAAVPVAYAQGLAAVAAAGQRYGWAIDPGRVAAVWRAGCIIRAALLDDVIDAFAADPQLPNLLRAPWYADRFRRHQAGWRRAVAAAVTAGVPVPGLGSALAYADTYRTPRLWANMIQAQRDRFGAHGFERLDRPGTFHARWRRSEP